MTFVVRFIFCQPDVRSTDIALAGWTNESPQEWQCHRWIYSLYPPESQLTLPCQTSTLQCWAACEDMKALSFEQRKDSSGPSCQPSCLTLDHCQTNGKYSNSMSRDAGALRHVLWVFSECYLECSLSQYLEQTARIKTKMKTMPLCPWVKKYFHF